MRVCFVSPNFPPEVNAPATRLHEHAREWVKLGGDVDVVTDVPNYPEGVVYPGYENAYSEETMDGIRVHRVPMMTAPNAGSAKRIASFVSFMLSAIWHRRKVAERPEVVVATSPQFFAALAGWWIAKRFKVPFVLEIRDLWPESIVAVGAMKRNAAIRAFERIERFLYRSADHIVVVTDAFVDHVVEGGAKRENVTVLKNGADLGRLVPPPDAVRAEIRAAHGWEGQFVAAYTGTIGMAHRADILLEAARICPDPEVQWVVIGTGAERAALEAAAAEADLDTFTLVDKQPRERILGYLAETDAAVVHLRDTPLFRTVLPSKLFEAMAFGVPIAHGVEGESRALVETAGAGIAFPPEDAEALVETVLRLKNDPALYARIQADARTAVARDFDRRVVAKRYWNLLERVAGHEPTADDGARSAASDAIAPRGGEDPDPQSLIPNPSR